MQLEEKISRCFLYDFPDFLELTATLISCDTANQQFPGKKGGDLPVGLQASFWSLSKTGRCLGKEICNKC